MPVCSRKRQYLSRPMVEGAVIDPHFAPELKRLSLPLRIRKDPLGFFVNLANRCGSHAWLKLMGSPVLFLNDASAVEHVFTKGTKLYHKGKYNEGLRPLIWPKKHRG